MKQALSLFLIALLVLALIPMLLEQQAAALTALSPTDTDAYTSVGSNTLEDRGGGIYNDGTNVWISEASTSSFKFSRYNIAGGTLTTGPAVGTNLVSAITNPTTTVSSTAKIDIFAAQRVGGTLQALNNAGTTVMSEELYNANAELIGKNVNELHIWLKITGAPTGTATIAVLDSVCSTVYSFGTQNVALLTTSFQEITYRGTGVGRTLASGDRIGVFFNGGSAGNSLDVEAVGVNRYDGANAASRTATGVQGSCTPSGVLTSEMKFEVGYNNVAANANDADSNTYWENSGYKVHVNQTNSDTAFSIGPGRASLPAFVGEKKTTSSAFNGNNTDTIELRLSKTGAPIGTASIVEVNADGSLTNRLNQITGTAFGCQINTVRTACAELITSGGALVGQTTNSVTFGLIKVTSPTGNLIACIMNSSAVCTYTFGSMPANSLTTSYAQYTFTNYAANHTIAANNYIGIVADVAPSGGTYSISSATVDVYDTTNSVASEYSIRAVSQGAGTNSNVAYASAGTGNVIEAEHINSGSVLIGHQVNSITVGLLRTGTPEPQDTVYACVFNSTGACIYTFGTIAATSLSTSVTAQTFTNGTATHTIASGNYIGIKYLSGSTSNTVSIAVATTNQWDGTATARAEFAATVPLNQATGTATGCIVASSTTNACAEKITATGALVGQTVDTLTGSLFKTGTPTGNITACVLNSSGVCIYTFGSIAASTITISAISYAFHNSTASYTIQSGDYIGFRGDTQTAGNDVSTTVTTTDVYDGTNSIRSQYTSGWVDTSTSDMGSSTSARNFKLTCISCGSWAADTTTDLGSSTANASWLLDCTTCAAWHNYGLSNGVPRDLGSATANQNYKIELLILPTIRNTFGTLDVSTLTTSELVYSFGPVTDFDLDSGATTYIGMLYSNHTGSTFNDFVNVAATGVDTYDGSNSLSSTFGSGSAGFSDFAANDLRFKLIDQAQIASDQEAGSYIYMDYGTATTIAGFRLTGIDATHIPQIVDYASSPDASVWTDRRADITLTQSASAQIVEVLGIQTSARYWRIQVDTWGASDFSWRVSEVEAILGSSAGQAMLSEYNSDGSIFTYMCASGSPCDGNGDVIYVSRINYANVVNNANSYTQVSGSTETPGTSSSDYIHSFGGNTNNGVYLLQGDCTCTNMAVKIHRFSYDLQTFTASLISFTDTTSHASGTDSPIGGFSKIVAFNTGGADTIRFASFWGNSKSINFYEGSTSLGTDYPGTKDLTTHQLLGWVTTLDTYFLGTEDLAGGQDDKVTFIANHVSNTFSTDDTDYNTFMRTDGFSVKNSTLVTLSNNAEDLVLGTATAWHGFKGSDGLGYHVPFYIGSTTPLTGTLTGPASATGREYYAGNGIFLTADGLTGTSWNIKKYSGSTMTASYYDEFLNVVLQANALRDTHAYTDQTLQIACDGLYKVRSSTLVAASFSDCLQFIIKDVQASAIGRELPFALTKDLVWAAEYTLYSIHVTSTEGNVDNFSVKIRYDGKDVDINNFDAGGNAQIRLLYGQCYDMIFFETLTSIVKTTTTVCADDVIFKEAILSSTLGFTFWTSPWGAVQTWNDTSNILTATVRHLPTPYNYTVQIYNKTNTLILTDVQTNNTAEVDSNNYNLTAFPNDCAIGVTTCHNPFILVILDENGAERHRSYFDTGSDFLFGLRDKFKTSGPSVNGWGMLLFIPIIFAAMFTRNSAGIGGAMTVTVIGVLVFFGVLDPLVFTPIIIGALFFVAIIGLLAYRILYG